MLSTGLFVVLFALGVFSQDSKKGVPDFNIDSSQFVGQQQQQQAQLPQQDLKGVIHADLSHFIFQVVLNNNKTGAWVVSQAVAYWVAALEPSHLSVLASQVAGVALVEALVDLVTTVKELKAQSQVAFLPLVASLLLVASLHSVA